MASPNYLAWAQEMGSRNPTADSLNNIGNTIDNIGKRKMMQDQLTRQNRLADLQIQRGDMEMKQYQDEQDYKQGLRGAMMNPATTTSITPDQMAPQEGVRTLAGMMPNALPTGQPQEFAMQPEAMSPTVEAYNEGRVKTTTESPAQAGVKYAMSQGRYDDVTKLMTVDELMGKYADFILESGGDPAAYRQAKAKRERSKETFALIFPMLKDPETAGLALKMAAKIDPDFNLITPEDIVQDKKGGYFTPLIIDGKKIEGKAVHHKYKNGKSDGEDVIDATPKAENEEQLTSRALKGDKDAQAILDAMQKRKVSIAKESRPIINNRPQTQTDFKNESSMRKEFLTLPEVKDFPIIEQNSKRALAALAEQGKGSNVAVDQSIITVFNKMLDPASVVRESEYARTPQDLSLLSRIRGKWDKIQRGGAGLDGNERQALYRMVKNFNDIANEQYNDQVEYYSGLASRYGYKPENIVRLGGRKAPTSNTPKPQGTGLQPDGKGGYVWKP